jgi:hypothetical protein
MVFARLVERGIVHHVRRRGLVRALASLPRDRYPIRDPAPREEVRRRVRAAVLGSAPIDARTMTLVAVGDASCVFDQAGGFLAGRLFRMGPYVTFTRAEYAALSSRRVGWPSSWVS